MRGLVARNGRVVDATGQARMRADMAIDGERIFAMGAEIGAGPQAI